MCFIARKRQNVADYIVRKPRIRMQCKNAFTQHTAPNTFTRHPMFPRFLAHITLPALLLVFLASCNFFDPDPSSESAKIQNRWYSAQQVSRGKHVFRANCQACHNAEARGTPDWRTPLANGSYPPPPLNGDAHTWHHNLDHLLQTVAEGGARYGGTMPAFKNKLSAADRQSVIAYIQSLWPEATIKSGPTK